MVSNVLNGTVQTFPPGDTAGTQPLNSVIWYIAQMADDMSPWGENPVLRDRQLRQFYKDESILASAIPTVAARNAAMEWELEGPVSTVERNHEMLQTANFGAGWGDFITKLSLDLLTQDKGAFIEIIKERENAPTLGIATLDSGRCYLTGNPSSPVVYYDRGGQYHILPYWRVAHITEMPTSNEETYGLQISAVTRILRAAQNRRSIQQYEIEKTSGRNNRAINIVSGVPASALQAALDSAQIQADMRGQTRYIQPAVLATLDPNADPKMVTVPLASLPDNYDMAESFREYIAIVALGLLTDYLELAPLPGGNLGSSQQSTMLDQKSKRKGAEIFRKRIEYALNYSGILPRNVTFNYQESDFEEKKEAAELRSQRASSRTAMRGNGEIDRRMAIQMALDDGDITQEMFDYMIAVIDTQSGQEPPTPKTDITNPGETEQRETETNAENRADIADDTVGNDTTMNQSTKSSRDYRPKAFAVVSQK